MVSKQNFGLVFTYALRVSMALSQRPRYRRSAGRAGDGRAACLQPPTLA